MEKNIKKIYMRKGSKGILKCIMTFILAVAMMTGAVPEMNLTAHASSYYTTYLVTSEDTDQTLPDKVVHFNNYDWYIIADNSTALDAGTITLFAKDNIGNSKFNPRYYGNSYNGSTIKGYLDNLISTTFLDMSDAIVSVDLQDVNVTGVKLWLLSTSETEGLNIKIRKCSSNWWLRTPVSSSVMGIDGGNGGFFNAQFPPDVDMSLGVRPALKLDLSKVGFNSATKTFSAIGQTVSVTNVNLESSTPQTIAVGDTVSFTASITPNEATDKTVKWKIGGTDAGALKLYTDAACETPLGTDATEVMTVYAKGISTGNAIVTCLSNSDSAKFASCEVTVNTLQTQIEEVLTTITATGAMQANFSTENVASLDLLKAQFNEVSGWNGTDMSIEVTAADGYTITRCVFYDDANHIATDSVSPFKAETHHLDTIPYVNGGPIYEGSRGIKKIDVIGYYTGNSVTITPGSNMTKTLDSGDALQNGLSGAMTAVVYTADDGYYFPTGYNVEDVNGISVTRDSYTQITVSGTPTADAAITLAEPTAKTKPDAPAVSAVNCTTAANNDGKLTGVTTAMEYKKSDATNWTVGTGNDITGLVPGTYYVRLRATDTTLVSDNQELVISAYTVPGQVVAPVFNPAAGTYTEAQSVTISCETTGADIYYTTNGSEPMISSTKYEGSISVAETTTIKAIAIKDGMENSEVTSATYTISEAMPTKYAVTVNDGTGDGEYVENTTVAITANEAPSGKIFESWTSDDGVTFADANATTTTFTMPAKAVTVTANYRNVDTVAMPTFSPVGGTYSSAQSVTISCSTTGADIYYTTNGNEPTTSSTKYTGAISISATTSVKAIAVKSGMTNSAVASAVYTIKTSPVITKAPEAITGLVYNGKAQALITAGEVTDGTLYYAVVKAGDAEPSAELYTTSIPTATNAGTYYVWYKVNGDSNHNDTEVFGPLIVSIAKASHSSNEVQIKIMKGDSSTTDLSGYVEDGGSLTDLNYVDEDNIFDKDPALDGSSLKIVVKDDDSLIGKTAKVNLTVADARNYEDYEIVAKVEVVGKHAQNLAFDSNSAELKVGDTYTNHLSGAKTAVTYASSDESVVMVESSGTITAISEGTATITATAEETDEYCSAETSYTVTVEKADQPSDTTPENNELPRVPLAEGEAYASPTDNIAAITSSGNIKDMKLVLSNVLKAGVDPSGLKMTVINGSKLTTVGKVKDKDSVKCTGGVKAKVSKKTGEVKISCKSSGSISLTMDDGVTYTLSLTVDKPKAQKAAKTMEKNTAPVKRTIQELFGTQITSGKLTITKDKNSRAEITEDKALLIKPDDKDTLVAQYEYLNKRYKITIKIK